MHKNKFDDWLTVVIPGLSGAETAKAVMQVAHRARAKHGETEIGARVFNIGEVEIEVSDPTEGSAEIHVRIKRHASTKAGWAQKADVFLVNLLTDRRLVVEDGAWRVQAQPRMITSEFLANLNEFLHSADRVLPVVAVTERTVDPVDVETLAARCSGRAHVVQIPKDCTWALKDLVGRGLDVYGGAVRIWLPGLHRDSPPIDHPLFLVDVPADDVAVKVEQALRHAGRSRPANCANRRRTSARKSPRRGRSSRAGGVNSRRSRPLDVADIERLIREAAPSFCQGSVRRFVIRDEFAASVERHRSHLDQIVRACARALATDPGISSSSSRSTRINRHGGSRALRREDGAKHRHGDVQRNCSQALRLDYWVAADAGAIEFVAVRIHDAKNRT